MCSDIVEHLSLYTERIDVIISVLYVEGHKSKLKIHDCMNTEKSSVKSIP